MPAPFRSRGASPFTQVSEFKSGQFHPENWPAYIEFEFDPTPQARYLVLPGLAADQDLVVFLCESDGSLAQRP